MSGVARSIVLNAAWELTRLRRSRRVWLWLVPLIAGPVGSAAAGLYLRVPSVATAEVLGLLITGGLSALVLLDLTALAVGEELALGTHFLTSTLPQGRAPALGGRLLTVTVGSLGAYAGGAGAAWLIAGSLVSPTSNAPPPIVGPWHLFLGLFAVLLFLGGVVSAGAVATRSAAQALVAGVLAGVVAAGVASALLLQHQLTSLVPLLLAGVGAGGWAWALAGYQVLES